MDLIAYCQIDDLESIMKQNGIEVPRLRGLRLMAGEEPVSAEELREYENNLVRNIYEDMCCAVPAFSYHSSISEYSPRTDEIREKYIDSDGEFRWNLLHGKKRRALKYAVRKIKKAVRDEISVWNRYAGRDDVLYIHARIGGPNWKDYGGPELEKQLWFLEKVDDAYDSTYCNIYAYITPQR